MASSSPGPCSISLYWIPVGAGTPRLQQASLATWEAVEAFRARRARATLVHAGLKLVNERGTHTLELMPAFSGGAVAPLATGPVGFAWAGRFRLFRYQLLLLPADRLPDEDWAIGEPRCVSAEHEAVARVEAYASQVPRHVWGRRVPRTREMWTSDSVVSWVLAKAGVDLVDVNPPPGTRAPGWQVGRELAMPR